MLTFEDFKKMEIKIAKVLEVNDHPNADKLYVITIDLADKTKQIVAGIKNYYTKESLVGRQVVVIDNLEPVIIRGVESQGMLLAAKDDVTLSILTTEREVKIGSGVS
jgi:methionyl-tRNA synthetase